MKRTWVLLCAVAALLVSADQARARCAGPRPAISFSGDAVPPDPVIHVFVPKFLFDEDRPTPFTVVARAGQRSLPVAFEEGPGTPAYRSYRVQVTTGQASHFALSYGDRFPVTRRFRVDTGWQRPTAVENSFTAVTHKDSWTCSFTDAWMLYPNLDAPAYLVEWAHDRAAVGSSAGGTLLAPRSFSLFWGDGSGGAQVALGHINCFDWTIPASARERRIYVRVAPLYADGSRGPFSDIVGLGDAPESEPPPPPPAAAPTADAGRPPAEEVRPMVDLAAVTDEGPRSPGSRYTAALWACFVGLGLGVLLVVRRRL